MAEIIPEKINVLWFIPTFGDSRYLGSTKGAREADFSYLKQIAQAADSRRILRRAAANGPQLRG